MCCGHNQRVLRGTLKQKVIWNKTKKQKQMHMHYLRKEVRDCTDYCLQEVANIKTLCFTSHWQEWRANPCWKDCSVWRTMGQTVQCKVSCDLVVIMRWTDMLRCAKVHSWSWISENVDLPVLRQMSVLFREIICIPYRSKYSWSKLFSDHFQAVFNSQWSKCWGQY